MSKRILLGITGGIAAYKTPELIRCLTQAGAEVQVVLSETAHHFVTPMTLQAVSGRPVRDNLFDVHAEAGMGHIELARWADCLLIAPASANAIAKLATGQASDLLSTVALACPMTTPKLIAPAMNVHMWEHPLTQQHINTLQDLGMRLLDPDTGAQACGDTGPGRMQEPEVIADALKAAFTPPILKGVHVLLTAGPTEEPLDPVRYLSNRSSGKMGYALAEAAQRLGATVTLISGPVALPTPAHITTHFVQTAREMLAKVEQHIDSTDIFIAAAAVSDYATPLIDPVKKKKTGYPVTVTLEETPDILKTVTHREAPPFTVGFAAQTHDLETHAREKLKTKRVDLLMANDVSHPDCGFGSHTNQVWIFSNTQAPEQTPLLPKSVLAEQLLERIAKDYHATES